MRKKIPYEIYSGTAFYQRREIKDALSYLRLLVFGDDVSFLRVVNVPARGIGKTRQNMLQEVAESKNVSRLCALRELAEHPLFKGTKARELLALLDEAKDFSRENDLADTLDFLLQRSGYEGYLRLCGNQDRLDNLNELKASVREAVDSAGEEVSAEDYLNGISLITSADAEDKKECVKLMTVHTAKGLEFPAVFVCCLNEGLFPSRKIRTREEMEEERRSAYVALTRRGEPFVPLRRGGIRRELRRKPVYVPLFIRHRQGVTRSERRLFGGAPRPLEELHQKKRAFHGHRARVGRAVSVQGG